MRKLTEVKIKLSPEFFAPMKTTGENKKFEPYVSQDKVYSLRFDTSRERGYYIVTSTNMKVPEYKQGDFMYAGGPDGNNIPLSRREFIVEEESHKDFIMNELKIKAGLLRDASHREWEQYKTHEDKSQKLMREAKLLEAMLKR